MPGKLVTTVTRVQRVVQLQIFSTAKTANVQEQEP